MGHTAGLGKTTGTPGHRRMPATSRRTLETRMNTSSPNVHPVTAKDAKPVSVLRASAAEILPLRTRHRQEMNCQIVHDSIHDRAGWTHGYRLLHGGVEVGFGSVAVAGPWKDKPTIFEFYVLPEHRTASFALFEAFLAESQGLYFEVQTSDVLLNVMLHAYGCDLESEKIVFADGVRTELPSKGTTFRALTTPEAIHRCLEERQGSGDYVLELEGQAIGTGAILFHYNRPYADLAMEVFEPFRRCGYGAYLVQELKRACYELGAIPAARCSPSNLASRGTLQKAGLVPVSHIVNARVRSHLPAD
jgi:GNAT superfamily N-acetyltransferase